MQATPSRPELASGYAIRPLTVDDAEAMAAAYQRNRDHLASWEPVRDAAFYTVEGQRDALERQLSLVQGGLLRAWVVVHDGQVVGRVNLNNVIRGVLCSASVGYWVDGAHLRLGLATASVEHACAEAVDLGLHRVEAGTMVHNVASQRVLLRAGFVKYGLAPKFLYIGGGWQDHVLYQRVLHDDPLPLTPPSS